MRHIAAAICFLAPACLHAGPAHAIQRGAVSHGINTSRAVHRVHHVNAVQSVHAPAITATAARRAARRAALMRTADVTLWPTPPKYNPLYFWSRDIESRKL